MTCEREYFSTLEDILKKYYVKTADNNILSAEGIGMVTVLEEINGQCLERKLREVLYVPGLRRNLFSISKITDRSFSFHMFQYRCAVCDRGGKLTSVGVRYDNLYRMLLSVKNVHSRNAVDKKWREQLYVWHKRLGHVNINSVINTNKLFPIDKLEKCSKFFCKVCINHGL